MGDVRIRETGPNIEDLHEYLLQVNKKTQKKPNASQIWKKNPRTCVSKC